jgi:hypothetical protein
MIFMLPRGWFERERAIDMEVAVSCDHITLEYPLLKLYWSCDFTWNTDHCVVFATGQGGSASVLWRVVARLVRFRHSRVAVVDWD